MAMKSHRAIAGLLCTAVVAAVGWGCAVKQPPPPAATLATALPSTTTVPAAYTTTGGATGAVATAWVQTFGDRQLEALVDEGLQNNLDLKAAASRVDVAAALVAQARSLLFPQISLLAGAGVVGRDSTKDRSGVVGEITWELDLWGRVRAQGASADAGRQATEADFEYARQSIAATIATLWYETITTEELRQAADAASAVYAELLRLSRIRNQIGQVGEQDIALASADLDRARSRERAYATTGQQVVRGLETMVGRYPSAELALVDDLPVVPAPVPEGIPSELLERRPDLVAAERRVAEAFHAIQVAQAARLPRIALTGYGGHSTSELLRLANVSPVFWTIAANFLAPIFTGGALKAAVDQATAEQQTALFMYGQTALRAFSEVESTLASEQLLGEQQRYLEAVLSEDTEALRLGRLRYDLGAADLFYVLELQARRLNTQFELIGIRGDRLANRIALHLALGGGFTPPPTP
jgi:NodT family efflux transporter outer membrane factor (OMF) lipoprotein